MKKINFNGLEHLDKKQIPQVVSLLSGAFSEDPCLKYLLDSDEYDYDKVKYLHEYSIKIGFLYGLVLTTSENIEGVGIWMPPKRVDTTPLMFIRAGGLNLKKTIGCENNR